MKIFKLIFKLILVLVFLVSVGINVLIFGSSYGSLLIKKDKNLLTTMVSSSCLLTSDDIIFKESNKGFIYTIASDTDIKTYTFYFDDKSNVTMKYVNDKKDGVDETTYYKDGFMYKKVGDVLTKESATKDDISEIYENEIYMILYFTLSSSLLDDNAKPKISFSFSFSPLYVLGIKVSVDKAVADYDLKGNLRKIKYSYEDDKEANITIKYSNSKITFPSFDDYLEA